VTRDEFKRLMNFRYLNQLASPGEAVGCIAGQSVGEPSTQMTLNTFHFAGRGEANVTLGIPRLRELLMAAAKKLATPVMTLPLLPHARTREQATSLARRLRRVRLAELIRKLTVTENPCGVSHAGTGAMARTFTVSMKLRGPKAGDDDEDAETSADVGSDSDSDSDDITAEDDDGKVSFTQMAKSFKKEFTKRLYGLVKLELRRRGANPGRIEVSKPEKADRGSPGAAGDDDDDEAPGDGGAGKKKKAVESKKDEKEDGEDGSDDEDEDEEEGAKTEDRTAARGDDGEGHTDADAKEKKEKVGHVKRVKTEGEVKAVDSDDDAMDEDSDEDSDSDSGSEDSDSDGDSGSDSSDGDEAEEAPKKKKATAKPQGTRTIGGDLLESLEDIVETVEIDREARTCTLRMSLKLTAPNLLVLELCEKVAAETIVRSVPGIDKTYVVGKLPEDDPTGKDPLRIQTDGVNFAAAWANDDLIDCQKLTTNDVYAMLQTFGVEAARQTLVQEVRNVFGVYGIAVDARHLTLIADFMMQQGNYRPCSRAGIETSTSPFLKMSYETAAAFLVDATMKGSEDTLESPSSRIVMGRVPDLGTGSFGLRYDMKKAAKMAEEARKAAGKF
jgi:DNA-directed RNA polymerase I subunit RPA1